MDPDFKNLLKVDSLTDCSKDAAWKSVAQNYTASNLGLDNQQTSLKVLQKLVIQVSNHFENNILSYAYAIKMDPQPKNIVVSFGVEAGAKQSDWLHPLQQVINGCQILRSSSPFSATGMGYMKMKPTN
uniref:Uncharacterized protein n=1 Tax=Acrobeloides nanus TaxID=290746 RepID=A0A914DRM4_9BILA